MPLLLRASNPKARKVHRCVPCMVTIEPGTFYRRETYIGDDGPYDWVMCGDCEEIADDVGAWAYDEVGMDSFEDWADENRQDERALAFLFRRFPTTKGDSDE
jgi:hypothetical protein